LVRERAPPYVDLSAFGPHGQRTQRNLKLHGMVPGPNGTLQRVESRGPPTIAAWSLCMEVFKSVVVGLGILTLPTIDDYIKKVVGYTHRYGDVCWLLIYQVDVRFRREFVERVRRELADEYQEYVAVHGNADHAIYDPSMPWESSYRAGTTGPRAFDYWHEHLEENALAVIAKARSLGVFIAGDAPVASDSRHHVATAGMLPESVHAGVKRPLSLIDAYPPPPEAHGGGGGSTRGTGSGGPPPKAKNFHLVVDGRFTANRRGSLLCVGFQAGSCGQSARNVLCPTGDGAVHQCAVCLSPEHGADHPRACTRKGVVPRDANKGKGKGKGKGKAKH
jgi:hypothetical protein